MANTFRTKYRGAQIGLNLNAQSVSALIDKGANFIRYQMVVGEAEVKTVDQWKDAIRYYLSYFDTNLQALCTSRGVRVVLDMHTPPGGIVGSKAPLFDSPLLKTAFLEMWDEIAFRYQSSDAFYAYDLLNEPAGNVGDVKTLLTSAYQVVRRRDKRKCIVVESAYGDPTKVDSCPAILDSKLYYSFHFYWPDKITAQGIGSNPKGEVYPTTKYNLVTLREKLYKAINIQKSRNVNMYVGEFSICTFADPSSRCNYLKDCIALFEMNNFQWTYHAWRESPVWDAESNPEVLKVLTDAWRKN